MGTISVRFDDRLQTVLRQPASESHDAAVRWRQLVDLIARAGPGVESEQMGAALAVIDRDCDRVDEGLRAATARAIAGLPLPTGLLAHFMRQPLTVSAPILAAAKLEPEHWRAMLGQAEPENRQFVESLHPYLANRPAVAPEEPASIAPRRSIGEVVERIERRRRRQDRPDPRPRASDGPRLFRFECDPHGELSWVEGAPRGALIGRSLAAPAEDPAWTVDRGIGVAFARRAPFRDAAVEFKAPGRMAGEWRLSANPSFDPIDGRFAGYRGIARRPMADPTAQLEAAQFLMREPESLRELVHELRTPLNAILGFAEIIDGQFLGPAGRSYRQTATDIAVKARLLLGAIEDLDLAARVQSGEIGQGSASDVGGITNRVVANIRRPALERGIEIGFTGATRPYETRAGAQYVVRLIERLFEAVMLLAGDGELIRVTLGADDEVVRLTISCPLADSGRCGPEPEQLEGDADSNIFAGLFSVRLVTRLAALAGGTLGMHRGSLILALPRL